MQLSAGDYVVLAALCELDEIGREARDAHNEVLIVLGLCLRRAESFAADDIELEFHAAAGEIGAHERFDL